RRMVAPRELERHAFGLSPKLSGSALLDLNPGAVRSCPALKVPDVPAEAHMAPLRPESIQDHHLNEVSPMGVVENSMGVELFDQHSVEGFSLVHEIPSVPCKLCG